MRNDNARSELESPFLNEELLRPEPASEDDPAAAKEKAGTEQNAEFDEAEFDESELDAEPEVSEECEEEERGATVVGPRASATTLYGAEIDQAQLDEAEPDEQEVDEDLYEIDFEEDVEFEDEALDEAESDAPVFVEHEATTAVLAHGTHRRELTVAELTERNREHLIQRILRTAGLTSLRVLYGLDSRAEVVAHLRATFAGNDAGLEEIRREVLDAKHLGAAKRPPELRRYLRQLWVLALRGRISTATTAVLDTDTLMALPADELGRLNRLLQARESVELARRARTYRQALDVLVQLTAVTQQRLEKERAAVSAARRIDSPANSMRMVGRLSDLRNVEIVVHCFGAADAYGVDPFVLLGIFFQEVRRSALRKRRLHSYYDYGLDNAFALRGEGDRRRELQLGALVSSPTTNENGNRVAAAWIAGLRDVLYYSAAQARQFQDRVLADFASAGLGVPSDDVRHIWLLIYWNGGAGDPKHKMRRCQALAATKNSGGWCRLLLARERGDVSTILENRRLVGRSPYNYANRVLAGIETLRRLGVAP